MDSYTKVTTKWYGSRIMDSIKGIIFWFILFIASFFVLWMNEWSVDLSEIAKTSTEVSSETINTANEWVFISITWEITSAEEIWDNLYLKPGNYISIYRDVEMFSWEESTETETKTNVWWSETTTTKYNYNKVWTSSPSNSSSFEISDWHNNPGKALDSTSNTVKKWNIWAFNLDTQAIRLPGNSPIVLTKDNTILEDTNTGAIALINWYLFQWKGSISNPEVWDIRISYSALNDWTNITAMWKQTAENIRSFSDKDWNTIYRVFHGTRSEAISTLRTEYLFMLWGLRILWFVLMWAWLSMLLWPISVLLDVLPIAWSLSRWIIWIITFVIAAILSIITIVISMIFHNIYALIIVVTITWFFLYKYVKKRMNKKDIKNDNDYSNNKAN